VSGNRTVGPDAVHRNDGTEVDQDRFAHGDLDFIHDIALNDGKFTIDKVYIAVRGRFSDCRSNSRGNRIVNMDCQVNIIQDSFSRKPIFRDDRFNGQGCVKVGWVGSRASYNDDIVLNRSAVASVKSRPRRVGVK